MSNKKQPRKFSAGLKGLFDFGVGVTAVTFRKMAFNTTVCERPLHFLGKINLEEGGHGTKPSEDIGQFNRPLA